jgi:quaternary ammonium compound-resistance protein SugE
MAWVFLILAGLMEIGWAIGMKCTNSFTRPLPSVATLGCIALSLFLLSLALKGIPLGTAYAVWTGIGAVGTALLGMVFFDEPAAVARVACLVMIVAGTVGLKFFSSQ